MDQREIVIILRGVSKMLKAVRSKRLEVLENPFSFDGICDALEDRAKLIDTLFGHRRTKKQPMVRARLYGPHGLYKGITMANGLVYDIYGQRVLKPNGRPWSAGEVAVEAVQYKHWRRT